MPNERILNLLNDLEDDAERLLPDFEGFLNVGRQTANGMREIFFACKDFRKPSKVVYDMKGKYAKNLNVNYEIYKDKYWQTLDKFSPGTSFLND